MKHFPKLQYPLDRRNLSPEAGLILLAYDMIWRWRDKASISHLEPFDGTVLLHDTEANLSSLGCFIEQNLGNDRFDAKDVELCEWKNRIDEENRKKQNPKHFTPPQ